MTASYWNTDSDPYQYPGTQLLNNLPDIRTAAALESFEQRAMALRLDEMPVAIAETPMGLAAWQTIHRILFQDVYSWAGQIRTVQLAKGNTVFAMPEHIEAEAKRVFDKLQREHQEALNHNQLVSRLAYYFGELNVLHPFREGNGRTQKLLFDEIARRARYRIDWAEMDVDTLLEALIAVYRQQQYEVLERLFEMALQRT